MEIATFTRLRALVFGRPTLVVDSEEPVPLFVHLEISRLNRLAFIVVRGHLTVDAARDVLAQLSAAKVPTFAKIIDISGMGFDVDERKLKRLAALARRASRGSRGRLAWVVDSEREAAGRRMEGWLEGEPNVAVCRSLHQARIFVDRPLVSPAAEVSQAAD